jgi:hypothetical protein
VRERRMLHSARGFHPFQVHCLKPEVNQTTRTMSHPCQDSPEE